MYQPSDLPHFEMMDASHPAGANMSIATQEAVVTVAAHSGALLLGELKPGVLPISVPTEQEQPPSKTVYRYYIRTIQGCGGLQLVTGEEDLLQDSEADQTEPVPTYEDMEDRLLNGFGDLVAKLDLEQLMVPSTAKPVKNPERFRLIPVKGRVHDGTTSLTNAGYNNSFDPEVTCTYENGKYPYLDSHGAIGLVYDKKLIAVSGAGLSQSGELLIVQLQDVSNVKKSGDPKAYYKTGLHNGFMWRDTLVKAWEEVATTIGAGSTAIQSHTNNEWDTVKAKGYDGYDAVAHRSGYVLSTEDSNWHKALR